MAFREASLETTASPATVWRVWSDVNGWPAWNPDMKESHLNGPLKLGATGMINTRSGGRHDVVVTHFEEGASFELESSALPGTRMAMAGPTNRKPSMGAISAGRDPAMTTKKA